jgi:hypothetical protein
VLQTIPREPSGNIDPHNAPLASGASRNLLPSRRHLIAFAVLLQAAVAALNQALIATLPPDMLRLWLYPAMAASIALLSWCTGRYLKSEWISWIVFAWSLALLNLVTIAVCLSGPIDDSFSYLMVTSQMSLIVLWAILGAAKWQWRVPVVLVATPVVMMFADVFMRSSYGRWGAPHWVILMLIATVVVALLCGTLRATGFALRLPKHEPNNSRDGESERVFQFGVRHMLVWSAALVPLLLVSRGLDFLVFGRIYARGMFPLVLMAGSLALINLTAIWAVLGSGPWFVRLGALLLVPLAFAFAMYGVTLYVESVTNRGYAYPSMHWALYDVDAAWVSWFMTGAMLLAALLLFLRAKGYRLLRPQT